MQIAVRFTEQTTVETGPQVKPRALLQQTFRFASAEILQVHPQVNFRVAVELGSPTPTRDALDFAVGFAPKVACRTTVRTTPGTVPGTVPTVVPGRSILASSTAPNATKICHLAGFGLTQSC